MTAYIVQLALSSVSAVVYKNGDGGTGQPPLIKTLMLVTVILR